MTGGFLGALPWQQHTPSTIGDTRSSHAPMGELVCRYLRDTSRLTSHEAIYVADLAPRKEEAVAEAVHTIDEALAPRVKATSM